MTMRAIPAWWFHGVAMIGLAAVTCQAQFVENGQSYQNRSKGTSLKAGDPISAANGAFSDEWLLFDLGGPMDLYFKLMYRSDPNYTWKRNPQDFPRNDFGDYQRVPFSWAPAPIMAVDVWGGLAEVVLPEGDVINFTGSLASAWGLVDTSTLGDPLTRDNGVPVAYQLQQSGDWFYFLDPETGRCLMFQYFSNTQTRVRYVVDRNGNRLDYTYATWTNTNPTRISDGLGRSLDFMYYSGSGGESNGLMRVTDHTGRHVDFCYTGLAPDNRNLYTLRAFSNAAGQVTTFLYQPNPVVGRKCELLSRIVTPLGTSLVSNEYGAVALAGYMPETRVVRQEDALGHGTTFAYENGAGSSYVARVAYPDGTSEIYEHFYHHAPPKALTDGAGATMRFAKNDHEQITAVTDRLGGVTALVYDPARRCLAGMTNASGQALSFQYGSVTQGFFNPYTLQTVYFGMDQLDRMLLPDGTQETYYYDSRGNVTSTVDQAGQAWAIAYNSLGLPTAIRNPAGGMIVSTWTTNGTLAAQADADGVRESYGYDGAFRLVAVTNGLGGVRRMQYDALDRVTNAVDELGHAYSFSFDANGNGIRVTDPLGYSTLYFYDRMDRLTNITDRSGHASVYSYDVMGRLQSFCAPDGVTRQYGYDARGWQVRAAIGPATWSNTYDAEGLLRQAYTPAGRTWFQDVNALGDATNIVGAAGQRVTMTYDSLRRPLAATDARGQSVTFQYDPRGMLTRAAVAGLGATSNSFNALGLLSGLHDLNGQVWAFGYSAAGRLTSQTDPLANAISLTYDAAGRMTARCSPGPGGSSVTNRYQFDAAGNLVNIVYSDGTAVPFAYDARGDLVSAAGIALARDAEGRVTNTVSGGAAFGASYNAAGRLSALTYYNGGLTVWYEYDANNGLLRRVSNSLTAASVSFQHDADGLVTNLVRGNGVQASFAYDAAGQMVRLRDGSFLDIRTACDAAGQATQQVATLPLDPVALVAPGLRSNRYDAASGIAGGYACDALGRVTHTPHGAVAWDAADRVTGLGPSTFAYDGVGALAMRIQQGQTNVFCYNYALPNTAVMTERNGAGAVQRYYVWTPDGDLLFMIEAGATNATRYAHFDLSGNLVALSDAAGQITDTYAYDPFGKLLGHIGASMQPCTFNGKAGARREGDHDYYRIGARWYDANTGRFLSREPLWPQWRDPRQANPYPYAQLAPILRVDRNGLNVTDALLQGYQDRNEALREAAATYGEYTRDMSFMLGAWQASDPQTRLNALDDPKRRAATWKTLFRWVQLEQEVKLRRLRLLKWIAGNRRAIQKALVNVRALKPVVQLRLDKFKREEQARLRDLRNRLPYVWDEAQAATARGDFEAARKLAASISTGKWIERNDEAAQAQLHYVNGLEDALEGILQQEQKLNQQP